MSYKQIVLAIRGYEKREMNEWERTRLVAYQVYAGIPQKGAKKPIQSYLPLPSDKQHSGKFTKESYEETRAKFLEKLRNKQNNN